MKLEKLIDSFISYNNGCSYNDKSFTALEIKKKFFFILNKLQSIDKTLVVGIKNSNKLDYLLSILACMRLNILYVPMGLSWPKEYIKKIKKKSGISLIIDSNFLKKNKKKVKRSSYKNNCLYMMFTSGSTGEPKGCSISKSSYLNFLKWVKNDFSQINLNHNILLNTNFTFDVSLMEIAILIINKNKFFLSDKDDTFSILKNINKYDINILCIVPNSLDLLIDIENKKNKDLKSINYLFIAGSQFYGSLYKKIKKNSSLKRCKVFNCYGPTEATIYCAYKKINLNKENIIDKNISIGRQINGNELKIKHFRKDLFVKNNNFGELYISGKQLMIGYEGKKDNGVVYINKKRYYPSGDIAKKINKNIYIFGRKDDTIKTSGNRVNLNTLDNILQDYEKISQSKTISIDDKIRDKIIITFLISKNKIFSQKKLTLLTYKYLRRNLPIYYLPHRIIFIKKLPISLSGKIDKNKLIKLMKI